MKKVLLPVFFIFAFCMVHAQDKPESSQPKVIVYNAEEGKKVKEFNPEYLVKINLISALSGDMGLAVERKLNDKISTEAGLGLTVKNFSQGLIVNFFDLNDGINNPLIDRQYKLGPSFTAALKYYPNTAIDEFYFGPEIRYRRYNSDASVQGDRIRHKEFVGLADFKINFGYINFVEDNIFIEYTGGIGIRNRNQNLLTSQDDKTLSPVLTGLNVFAPLISFGLKIGFVAN
jgi:hypothetical protein